MKNHTRGLFVGIAAATLVACSSGDNNSNDDGGRSLKPNIENPGAFVLDQSRKVAAGGIASGFWAVVGTGDGTMVLEGIPADVVAKRRTILSVISAAEIGVIFVATCKDIAENRPGTPFFKNAEGWYVADRDSPGSTDRYQFTNGNEVTYETTVDVVVGGVTRQFSITGQGIKIDEANADKTFGSLAVNSVKLGSYENGESRHTVKCYSYLEAAAAVRRSSKDFNLAVDASVRSFDVYTFLNDGRYKMNYIENNLNTDFKRGGSSKKINDEHKKLDVSFINMTGGISKDTFERHIDNSLERKEELTDILNIKSGGIDGKFAGIATIEDKDKNKVVSKSFNAAFDVKF